MGSDFLYAVYAGVHDVARLINDAGGDNAGEVAMISISGGLRDEMIPPEACQVPSISRDDDRSRLTEMPPISECD